MWEYAGACAITFLVVFLCVGGFLLYALHVGSSNAESQ